MTSSSSISPATASAAAAAATVNDGDDDNSYKWAVGDEWHFVGAIIVAIIMPNSHCRRRYRVGGINWVGDSRWQFPIFVAKEV